jgi:hypothetical protein
MWLILDTLEWVPWTGLQTEKRGSAINGAKPNRQRGSRVLKYRSSSHRGLVAAGRALKQHASNRP